MAVSERIQQLCPAVSKEQATKLREFLVEANERLQAKPALMGSSLKTLEQETKDQGYAWDSIVLVMRFTLIVQGGALGANALSGELTMA